jgi:hypothetical protein
MPANIEERCNAVEECYEFMLAYAAQGLPSDEDSQSAGQVCEFLDRAVRALEGMAEICATTAKEEASPAERYQAFSRCSTAMPDSLVVIGFAWHNRRSAHNSSTT